MVDKQGIPCSHVFIVCALACEAAPLISHYRLKGDSNRSPFSFYEGESFSLIISGVGRIQTAAAVGYLQALSKHRSHPIWINVGIAGHRTMTLGAGVLAHQIIDQASGHTYYPQFVVDRPVTTGVIMSVDKPEQDYALDVVYDMEASAFWQIASKMTTAEFVHAYKIISDNQQSPLHAISKKRVHQWMEDHLPPLTTFIDKLKATNQILTNLELTAAEIALFTDRWHFSFTQLSLLKKLLLRWKACNSQSSKQLLTTSSKSSGEFLRHLEGLLTFAGSANV